ncbi:MAG: hypothetical protein ACRDOD_25860 [Streptosporangiaceae bacterium]
MSKRRRSKPRPGPTPTPERSAPAPASNTSITATEEPSGTPPALDPAQVRHLVGAIATGILDEHLATVSAAISRRHRQLVRIESNQAGARIKLGDRVRINHTIRPLYLNGATGTLIDWTGQRAVVQLDHPTGRFTTGEIRCPPLGLDHLHRPE